MTQTTGRFKSPPNGVAAAKRMPPKTNLDIIAQVRRNVERRAESPQAEFARQDEALRERLRREGS